MFFRQLGSSNSLSPLAGRAQNGNPKRESVSKTKNKNSKQKQRSSVVTICLKGIWKVIHFVFPKSFLSLICLSTFIIFVSYSLSQSFRNVVMYKSPQLDELFLNISDNFRRPSAYISDVIQQSPQATAQKLTTWIKEEIIIKETTILLDDTLRSLFDLIFAFLLCIKQLSVFSFRLFCVFVDFSAAVAPVLVPFVSAISLEVYRMSPRSKCFLFLAAASNLLFLVLWRKNVIQRVLRRLRIVQKHAQFVLFSAVPFTAALLLFYIPVKMNLSFSLFHAVFQNSIAGLAALHAAAALTAFYSRVRVKRPQSPNILSRQRTTDSAVSEHGGDDGSADPGALSHRSWVTNSMWSSIAVLTPRVYPGSKSFRENSNQQQPVTPVVGKRTTAIVEYSRGENNNINNNTISVSEDEKQQVIEEIFRSLGFWDMLVVWHGLMLIPLWLFKITAGFPIPVFNSWLSVAYGGRSSLPLFSSSTTVYNFIAPSKLELLTIWRFHSRGYLTTGQWVTGLFAHGLVMLDELMILLFFLSSHVANSPVSPFLRNKALSITDGIFAQLFGLRLFASQSPFDTDKIASSGLLLLASSLFQQVFSYIPFSVSQLSHFVIASTQLLLLFVPSFLLRIFIPIPTLLIPLIASLRAIKSRDLPKAVYWLSYTMGLLLLSAGSGVIAHIFPLWWRWMPFKLTIKVILIFLVHVCAVQPELVGEWIVKTASRVSVQAVASARKRLEVASAPRQYAVENVRSVSQLTNGSSSQTGLPVVTNKSSSAEVTTEISRLQPESEFGLRLKQARETGRQIAQQSIFTDHYNSPINNSENVNNQNEHVNSSVSQNKDNRSSSSSSSSSNPMAVSPFATLPTKSPLKTKLKATETTSNNTSQLRSRRSSRQRQTATTSDSVSFSTDVLPSNKKTRKGTCEEKTSEPNTATFGAPLGKERNRKEASSEFKQIESEGVDVTERKISSVSGYRESEKPNILRKTSSMVSSSSVPFTSSSNVNNTRRQSGMSLRRGRFTGDALSKDAWGSEGTILRPAPLDLLLTQGEKESIKRLSKEQRPVIESGNNLRHEKRRDRNGDVDSEE